VAFVRKFSGDQRLAVTGTICSVLVLAGGFIAMIGTTGVLVASLLLSVAILSGAVGLAYSRNRELGWGLAALIAAGLPLFYLLYAAGAAILKQFGPGMAGGLLLILAVIIGVGSAMLWLRAARPPTHIQH